MLQHQQHSGKAKHQIRPKQQGMLLQGHNNEEHENEKIVLSHFYDISFFITNLIHKTETIRKHNPPNRSQARGSQRMRFPHWISGWLCL